MTTVSHIGISTFGSKATPGPALHSWAQYPKSRLTETATQSAYLFIIYSDLGATRSASRGNAADHRGRRIHPKSAAEKRRWQTIVGGSSALHLSVQSILRGSASAQHRSAAAHLIEKETTYKIIRHNTTCCGGSIFARYD